MGGVLSLVAVLVSGWLIAAVLLRWMLKAVIQDNPDPGKTLGTIIVLAGLALVPAAPAVAAWLAAQYGWSVAAWVLGVLTAVLAVILGSWVLIGSISQS